MRRRPVEPLVWLLFSGGGVATALFFPILLFLIAKVVAYTLLGALLGLLGSYLTLSPLTRAILMILIVILVIVKPF